MTKTACCFFLLGLVKEGGYRAMVNPLGIFAQIRKKEPPLGRCSPCAYHLVSIQYIFAISKRASLHMDK